MKDVCGGDFWGIICQRRSGPYLTTVQTSCQSKDLEKPRFFFYALVVTSSVNSGYGRFEVVCHLLSSCVYASIPSISDFKVFHWVTSSRGRGVPLYVKVGIAEVILLKKTMTSVLSVFRVSPLKRVCLQKAKAQHSMPIANLNRQGYREVKLHVILVGVMGTIYKVYTDKPLADLNLDYHKIIYLTHKLNEHFIRHASALKKIWYAPV